MEKSLFATDGLYARVMNQVWNVLVISVLWVLCCIPVVTFGASCTAAYYTAAKVIRAGEGKPAAEFLRAFKLNFRQSAVPSLVYGAVLAVLLLECFYLYTSSDVSLPVLYLFYGMVLLCVSSAQYFFAALSRFSLSNLKLLRIAVFGSFRYLITTIILLLLLLALIVGVYLMPWGILLFPGIMFWLQTFLMERILRKHMDPPTDEEAADKWYYNI